MPAVPGKADPLFRVPLVDPETRPARTPEVMAGKILALLDRIAARNLYDVAAFAAAPSAYDLPVLRCLFIA